MKALGLSKLWTNFLVGRIFSDYLQNISLELQKKNCSSGLKGGVDLNRKILGIVVSFIAIAMLASPVLAIGPINVPEDNNPNIDFPNYGVALNLPSGVFHEWVQLAGKYLIYKDASKFKIKNAVVVTDVTQLAELENKWVYFSAVTWGDWLVFVLGIPQYIQDPTNPGSTILNPIWIALHAFAMSHFPEGVYYKEVLVGN